LGHCTSGGGFSHGLTIESLAMPEMDENRRDPLPLREVELLVELVRESGMGEIRVRQGETEISVRARPEISTTPPANRATSGTQGVPEGGEPERSPEMDGLHAVRSPVVGTFYRAPAPGEDPYVEVGDLVSAGQTLCIVEAMKLMNEIVADVSGEVVEVLAENAGGVEYDQPLFYLRPDDK
jgi:acetyl-CoA carboxylase biotin carboxyl carrier protein